jgi:Uncharacterized protein involved in propionate catabolism
MDQGDGPETLVVEHPLGGVANPMTSEQIEEKFLNLSSEVLTPAQQQKLVSALRTLSTDGFQPLFDAW